MNLISRFGVVAALLTLTGCGFFQEGNSAPQTNTSVAANNSDITYQESLSSSTLAAYRLTGALNVTAAPAGRYHPTHKISRIGGMNITRMAGRGSFDASAVQQIARTALIANRDLVGLPVNSGKLVADGVKVADTLVSAKWHQVATLTDGSEVPVQNSGVTVHFNANGDLTQILNLTYTGVDGLAPANLSAAQAAKNAQDSLTEVAIDDEIRPFSATGADVEGLVVYVDARANKHLAYLVTLEGNVTINSKPKRTTYGAYINAYNGNLIESFAAQAGAFKKTGVVEVYDPNPIENPTYYTLPAYKLDDQFHSLKGPYASVTNGFFGTLVDPNYEFKYISGNPTYPEINKRADAEAYHHTYKLMTYAKELGFPNLVTAPIYVDAFEVSGFASAYQPTTHQVWINVGAGQPDADDADIIGHEYFGHAINHQIGGQWTYGYPFDNPDNAIGNGAMDEGISDYRVTSFLNDRELAEVFGQTLPGGYLRNLHSDENIVNNWHGNRYDDGIIWASTFWNLRSVLGKGIVDRLAIQFVYHILPTDTFNTALETAILQADQDLYVGIHEDTIRQVFAFAKVYGSNTDYLFTTNFVQSPIRPYPDNENSEQVLNINNASLFGGIRFTFGDMSDVNENDRLEVRNDRGTLITTLTQGQIAGTTVVVSNSNKARIKVISQAGDSLGGKGYNIVAASVVNSPGRRPVVNATITPAVAMDPAPATISVYGPNLRSVKLNLGDGSPVAYPVKDATGHWVYQHVFNRDGVAPITVNKRFDVTIEVTNDEGLKNTGVRSIRVRPYTGFDGPHVAAAPSTPTKTMSCTLSQTGLYCP